MLSGMVAGMDVFYTEPLIGIVKAKSLEEWFDGYISKWKGFVAGGDARFHLVGGTHRTMISPPNLVGFVKTFRGVLEGRDL